MQVAIEPVAHPRFTAVIKMGPILFKDLIAVVNAYSMAIAISSQLLQQLDTLQLTGKTSMRISTVCRDSYVSINQEVIDV